MKKILLALTFVLLLSSPAWSATKYARGVGGNWSADATWSTTSGGAADTTKCVDGDACFLDASSGNVTVDVASAATSLDCTGYTGTLTLGANLTLAGNLTLVSVMTFTPSTYTVIFSKAGALSVTTGGKEFYGLTFNITTPYGAITLGDNVTVNGTFTNSTGSYITDIAGAYTLHLKGDVVCSGLQSLSYLSDSAASISIDGSSAQAVTLQSDNSYPHRINVDINSLNTVTFQAGTHQFAKSFTKTAGTVDLTTNSTVVLIGNNIGAARNLGGFTFYDLTVQASASGYANITVDADITINNAFSLPTGFAQNFLGNNIYAKGAVTASAGTYLGTSSTTTLHLNTAGIQAVDLSSADAHTLKLTFDGSGTVNMAAQNIALKNDVVFNGTGTYNLANTITYAAGTITYTAGTVAAGTSTLSITGSCTLATNGMSWYNVTFLGTPTVTLSSDMTATGTTSIASQTSCFGAYTYHAKGDITWTNAFNFGYPNNDWDLSIDGTVNQTLGSMGVDNYLNLDTVVNKVSGTFTLANTTLIFATWRSGMTFTYTTAGAFSAGTSVIQVNGNSTYDFGGVSIYDLTINSAKIMTLASALNVTHNITITGELSPGSNTVTIGGNWTNNGTFTAGTSTVEFVGAITHTIDGSTAFYSLTCGTGETCTFDDVDTFSTNASGVLAGDGTWQSDLAGTPTDLNVNGTETITSGICHDVTNAGTTIVTSGTLDNCSGWSNSSSAVKTVNGLAIGSVKTKNGLAIASIKNFNGLA